MKITAELTAREDTIIQEFIRRFEPRLYTTATWWQKEAEGLLAECEDALITAGHAELERMARKAIRGDGLTAEERAKLQSQLDAAPALPEK